MTAVIDPPLQFNARRGNARRNIRRRHDFPIPHRRDRRWLRRRRRISWPVSPNRNAGRGYSSNPSNGPGFRCRVRTFRNEIRKSAWEENNLLRLKNKREQYWQGGVAASPRLVQAARPHRITVIIFPDAADGRGSSGPGPRHWWHQKETPVLAIQRGHRKRPHWLCLDAGNWQSPSLSP
jgi:hypothetical protein